MHVGLIQTQTSIFHTVVFARPDSAGPRAYAALQLSLTRVSCSFLGDTAPRACVCRWGLNQDSSVLAAAAPTQCFSMQCCHFCPTFRSQKWTAKPYQMSEMIISPPEPTQAWTYLPLHICFTFGYYIPGNRDAVAGEYLHKLSCPPRAPLPPLWMMMHPHFQKEIHMKTKRLAT